MISNIQLQKIRDSSVRLSSLSESERNNFLKNLIKTIESNQDRIIEANKKDIENASTIKLSKAFIERLNLDESGIQQIIQRIKNTINLDSGVGSIFEKKKMGNGLEIAKMRVPIGVVFVIYESRPEVTVDVATLCIKSGNAAILKAGKESFYTNKELIRCIQRSLIKTHLPADCITLLTDNKRTTTYNLLKETDYIDLVIARGGYEMVCDMQNRSKIPVLAHSAGGARIYVDKSADLNMAENIIINAKISKPSACNSVDTILVHKDVAHEFLPQIFKKFKQLNIRVRKELDREFLDFAISVQVVSDEDEALELIRKYSKHHTEGLIAGDNKVIEKFAGSVDAAALFINCSTRFHDGGEFGLGCEMGIATGKFHARGPVGLSELTTYKWIVRGKGQIR